MLIGSSYACQECGQENALLLQEIKILRFKADIAQIRLNRLQQQYEQMLLQKFISKRKELWKLSDTPI